MKSRWLVQSIGGTLYRTVGYYTQEEVQQMLHAKPVRRIRQWEWLTDWLSKTWRRVAQR